jgi:hypothetical protein
MSSRVTHILLEDLRMRVRVNNLTIEGYVYDEIQGRWACPNGNALVENVQFLHSTSKKRDIETGEDQK